MAQSPLLDRILNDVKEAMKSRQQKRVDTLRTLHSDIKNVSINNKVEISDEICLDQIAKTIKQKNDALEQFRAAGRTDLVEEEEMKIEFLKAYLPQQLSEAELEALVKEAIAEVGATSKKEMGAVMKALAPRTKGRAEGKTVSALVQKLLP